MFAHARLPSGITFILRSNATTRYLLLTFVLLFVLYRATSTWTPHQALVPTRQNTTPEPTTSELDVLLSSPHYEFETPSDSLSTVLVSRIGKVTSIYYNTTTISSQAYERALLSHRDHNTRYGYKHFVQRRNAIEGAWSKHAYLIHILVQELNKSPAERLDWLFWHDADVVLLNSLMPLEAYLPHDVDRWAHIHLLIANDLGGLNDGTFFVRVCEWSVYFFAAGLSFPYYRPEVNLRFDEQTALGFLLDEKKWKNNTLHVPQRWFNAYHNFGSDDSIPEEWNWKLDYVEPGDLLVHLPGTADARSSFIDEWLERLQHEWDAYNLPLNSTAYPAELEDFWNNHAETESERQDEYWRHYHILNKIGGPTDDVTRDGKKELENNLVTAGKTDSEIQEAVEEYEKDRKEIKKELLRDYEKAVMNGTKSDNVRAD